jgi:magnesium transporter
MPVPKTGPHPSKALDEIVRMLDQHRVLDDLAHRQDTPRRELVEDLQRRQNVAALQRQVRTMHAADLAFVLESLPRDARLAVWRQAEPGQAAQALLEADEVVRQSLIRETEPEALTEILRQLDVDDLASLTDAVPPDIMRTVRDSLEDLDKILLQDSIAYPADTVGHLMTRDSVVVRDSQTIGDVLTDLRSRGSLPPQSDRLFVVDARNVLRGALGLQALLVESPSSTVVSVMDAEPLAFVVDSPAAEAARAFERYDLLSAPVTNEHGKLIGRVRIDAVMDYVRAEADAEALAAAGLSHGEDLFAPVWTSTRNRSPWLFVNLVTAFVATRVIGLFESAIQEVVALATLMPIVASIGGNTGNQTVALIIRGLGADLVTPANFRRVLRKELVVSAANGMLWGTVAGIFAAVVYGERWLALVMAGAVLLNLIVASVVGVAVPLTLHRYGRDPAQGSSVLLTFATDSLGFLIFLGLARLVIF